MAPAHYLKYVMRKLSLFLLLLLSLCPMKSFPQSWPAVEPQMRPYSRWWWLGSAVTYDGLTSELDYLEKSGIGGLEVTPIYGVQGNEANDVDFLSTEWMKRFDFTQKAAKLKHLQVDMNGGTGWPFGGPQITPEHAATKAIFQNYTLNAGAKSKLEIKCEEPGQSGVAVLSRVMAYNGSQRLDVTSFMEDGVLDWKAPKTQDGTPWHLIALFVGKTFQEVNRAAPGGEGLVMDHFSSEALDSYLLRLDEAFKENGTTVPHSFFNDSYEVYGADWTPDLLEEFHKRRGYALETYFPEFLDSVSPIRTDLTCRVVSDYRETLSDLLKENFTQRWNAWAHEKGAMTRSQAHGSPGNLIDLYAIVDIPECEGFGLSDFGIKGLRKDSLTRKNDCDLSMLKYASSAAHISGKRLTSSETFTWLTEHFRTSFSQCKPDLDLMFVSGVNHIFFHGTAYSPTSVPWPGWRFYASVDMSRQNPQFERDMPEMSAYISRVQSFMQTGEPDNDFLLYLPIYDIWDSQKGRFLPFEIDHMQERTPEFINIVNAITNGGYDVDYISDDFILTTTVQDGRLVTSGGTRYGALVIPTVHMMPEKVMSHLVSLAKQGATVIFIGDFPKDVPGLGRLEERRKELEKELYQMPDADFGKETAHPFGRGRILTGSDYARTLALSGAQGEQMKTAYGLQFNRRKDSRGSFYFISCLQEKDVDGWVTLSRNASQAVLYDPMTGASGQAALRTVGGKTQVYLQISSGASLILRLYDRASNELMKPWNYLRERSSGIVTANSSWSLSFIKSEPEVSGTLMMDTPRSWTLLEGNPNLQKTMATGCYKATFNIPEQAGDVQEWILDLGDVRESARVLINGKDAGILWAVPYRMRVEHLLHKGDNLIEVEVINLPANRIADFDRRGQAWRIFKNINVVNIHYEPSSYASWDPMPSGLCSQVRLLPADRMRP